jgi:hypothetical protein
VCTHLLITAYEYRMYEWTNGRWPVCGRKILLLANLEENEISWKTEYLVILGSVALIIWGARGRRRNAGDPRCGADDFSVTPRFS